MGAAPSSEVLAQAPFCSPGAGTRQIALLPTTREFFPSADCTLFRQLYEARIDPSVRYYVRHKLNVLAQDVIPPFPCTREELYRWYVYYTPRLCYPNNAALRADAMAGCMHRIHPVPCAVVFLYRGAAHHMPEDCVPLPNRDNVYVKVVGGIADLQPFLASLGEEGPADKPAQQERTLQMQMFITKSAGDHNMAHVVLLAAYIYQHQCLDLIGLPRMPNHGVAFKNYQTNIPFLCFLRELRDRTASLLDATTAVRLWLDGPLIRGYVPASSMARLFDAFSQHYVAFVEAKTNQRLLKAQAQQHLHLQQHPHPQIAAAATSPLTPPPPPQQREISFSQSHVAPSVSSDEALEDEKSVMDMLDKAVMAAQDEADSLQLAIEDNNTIRAAAAGLQQALGKDEKENVDGCAGQRVGEDVAPHGVSATQKEQTNDVGSQPQTQQQGYYYYLHNQATNTTTTTTTTITSSNIKCCCEGSGTMSSNSKQGCVCGPALCACGPDLGTFTEESNSLSTTLGGNAAWAGTRPPSSPMLPWHNNNSNSNNSGYEMSKGGQSGQTVPAVSAFAAITPQPSLTGQTSSSCPTTTTTTTPVTANTNGTNAATTTVTTTAVGTSKLPKMTPADTAVLAVVNNARIVPPARKQSYTVKGYIVAAEAVIPDYCDVLDGVYVVCTDSVVRVCHGVCAPFVGISSRSVAEATAATQCGTRRESGVSSEGEGTRQETPEATTQTGPCDAKDSVADNTNNNSEAGRVMTVLHVHKGDILSFTPHEDTTSSSGSNDVNGEKKATTAIVDTHASREGRPDSQQQKESNNNGYHASDPTAPTVTMTTTPAGTNNNNNSSTKKSEEVGAGMLSPQHGTTDTTTYDESKLRYGSWRVDPSVYLESVLLSMVSDECRRAREAGPDHANWVRDPVTHELVHDDNFYIWRFIRNGQEYYYGTVPHFASIHKRSTTLRGSHVNNHHANNNNSSSSAYSHHHHRSQSHLAARQQQQRVGSQAQMHAMHVNHMAFLHAQQQQQQRALQESEVRRAMMPYDGYSTTAAMGVGSNTQGYGMLPPQPQVMMMMPQLPLQSLPQPPQQPQQSVIFPTAAPLLPSPFVTEAHPFARTAMSMPAMQAFLPQPTFFPTNAAATTTATMAGNEQRNAEYDGVSSLSSGHAGSAATPMTGTTSSTNESGYPPLPPPMTSPHNNATTTTGGTSAQIPTSQQALLRPSAPFASPFATSADLTSGPLRSQPSNNNNTSNIAGYSSAGGSAQGNGLPTVASAPTPYVFLQPNTLPGRVTPLAPPATLQPYAGQTGTGPVMMMPLPQQQQQALPPQPPPYSSSNNAECAPSCTPLTNTTATTDSVLNGFAVPSNSNNAYSSTLPAMSKLTAAQSTLGDMPSTQTQRTSSQPTLPGTALPTTMMMPYTTTAATTSNTPPSGTQKEPGMGSNTMYYIVRTDGQPRLTTLQQTPHGLTPVLMPPTSQPAFATSPPTTTTATTTTGSGGASQQATRPMYVVVRDGADTPPQMQVSLHVPGTPTTQAAAATAGLQTLLPSQAPPPAPGIPTNTTTTMNNTTMNNTSGAGGVERMQMRRTPSQHDMSIPTLGQQPPYSMMLPFSPPLPHPNTNSSTTNTQPAMMMMMPTSAGAAPGGNAMQMAKEGMKSEAGGFVTTTTTTTATTQGMNATSAMSRLGQHHPFAQQGYVCYQDAAGQPMAMSGVNGCYMMPGNAASASQQQQQQQAMYGDLSRMYVMR